MLLKSGKHLRKDNATTDCSQPGIVDMDAIADMLVKHKEELSSEFKVAFSTLEKKLDLINSKVEDHEQHVLSLESNANATSDRIVELEKTCAALASDNAKLKAKTMDLEGRSCRNNARIVGLPESVEGPRPSEFFPGFLVEVMGDQVLSSPPELEHSHQVSSATTKSWDKPRAVVFCFHKFQTGDLVVREARRMRGKLNYRGAPIHIFEDYPPEVLEQHREYRDVMSDLYNLGFKPALCYPARLFITTETEGMKRLFTSQEARQFVSSARRRPMEPAAV